MPRPPFVALLKHFTKLHVNRAESNNKSRIRSNEEEWRHYTLISLLAHGATPHKHGNQRGVLLINISYVNMQLLRKINLLTPFRSNSTLRLLKLHTF